MATRPPTSRHFPAKARLPRTLVSAPLRPVIRDRALARRRAVRLLEVHPSPPLPRLLAHPRMLLLLLRLRPPRRT